MRIKLYYHPLASYCHKALIALYENQVDFTPVLVDLGDGKSRAEFAKVWPMLKFPVLVDEDRGNTAAESGSVIEYIDAFFPSGTPLIPTDPKEGWKARMWDGIFDDFLQTPMQKIVGDSLRPEGKHDPHGVEEAKGQLKQAYDFLDKRLPEDGWAAGAQFSLADCSAAPAFFYADTVLPLGDGHSKLKAYLGRLKKRPSFARVLSEAEPYFRMFPLEPKPKT